MIMKERTIKNITYMAVYLALFLVFDWLGNTLQLLKMPQGGSLGISAVPLLLCSYHLGWKKGVAVSVLAVVLMFMAGKVYIIQNSDGFASWQIAVQFFMEYPLAFGIYGTAGLFKNYGALYSGTVITNLIRFVIHTAAGCWFWFTPLWPSITYNAWYMIPTMLLCMAVMPILAERLITLPFFNTEK